jgi:hypothetical protein
MRVSGWALIVVFGGAVLFMFASWIVQTLNGYYVDGESTTALIITVVLGLVAALPIGLGAWLVRRAGHPR